MSFRSSTTKLLSHSETVELGYYRSTFSVSFDVYPSKIEYRMNAEIVREDDTDAVDTLQACVDQIDLVLRAYNMRATFDKESGSMVIVNMQFGDGGKPTFPRSSAHFVKIASDLLDFIKKAPVEVPKYRAERLAL